MASGSFNAVLAGLACASRSMIGPAALAARGRIGGPARAALLAASAGEIGVDKTSFAMDRTAPPSLVWRITTGAVTGRAVDGGRGALVGGVAAAAGTYLTFKARALIVERTGLPDWVVAVGEDLLAATLAAAATRSVGTCAGADPREPQDR